MSQRSCTSQFPARFDLVTVYMLRKCASVPLGGVGAGGHMASHGCNLFFPRVMVEETILAAFTGGVRKIHSGYVHLRRFVGFGGISRDQQ